MHALGTSTTATKCGFLHIKESDEKMKVPKKKKKKLRSSSRRIVELDGI